MVLASAGGAHARATPEQQCQKGRVNAAAKYAACQQKELAKYYGGSDFSKFQRALGKCVVRYTGTWPKLQKKASGTGATCDTARFVDNVIAVFDSLTGLQWEKKTDDATVHDKDNVYTWSSADGDLTDADGTAYTSFLTALNGACFAGQCDWRLPTFAELQTILLKPHPCGTSPCIDSVFGITIGATHWSATTSPLLPSSAWSVNFAASGQGTSTKNADFSVRAVRAGL